MLSLEEMTANIVSGYMQSSVKQRMVGRLWYPSARNLAEVVGNGNVRKGAGVIAALSPNKSWTLNQVLALRAAKGDFSGHVTNALDKARAIMAGLDPTEVLPMDRKTGHFFMNIVDPRDDAWATVDRHAIRVALLTWDDGSPTVTPKQYPVFVQAYQRAANLAGVHTSEMQAITWVWAKER